MLKKIILILPLISLTLYANPKLDIPEVVVKTYQYDDSKEGASTYSIEIHTDKEISNSGSPSLFDFLSQHTSLNVLPNYGSKTKPNIDMRGYGIENGYQNIVISVDGARMNNIDMSAALIGSIPIDSIARIEITRGAGSVKFGDGAMAGTIQIFTKDYTGYSINSATGSAGFIKNTITAGYANDLLHISFDA